MQSIYEKGNEPTAVQEIDASGCLVMPGLIDTHLHMFHAGTENGIIPDLTLLPIGELGLSPLEKALKIAEKIGTRISVHTTNTPVPVSEFINLF